MILKSDPVQVCSAFPTPSYQLPATNYAPHLPIMLPATNYAPELPIMLPATNYAPELPIMLQSYQSYSQLPIMQKIMLAQLGKAYNWLLLSEVNDSRKILHQFILRLNVGF